MIPALFVMPATVPWQRKIFVPYPCVVPATTQLYASDGGIFPPTIPQHDASTSKSFQCGFKQSVSNGFALAIRGFAAAVFKSKGTIGALAGEAPDVMEA